MNTFYTITYPIDVDQQGKILEVPFQVPMDVDTVHIEMNVVDTSKTGSTVDLGIRDPYRVRGWSGGARRSVAIGKEHATPGYLKGEIATGEWAVLLGAYQIEKDCIVELKIRCEIEESVWLKGDLHGHSVHSDGSYTLLDIMHLAEESGLDFIALTDHNTVSQNFVYPRESKVTFIPGMELTTYRGHCNIYGVDDPMDDFRTPSLDMLVERIRSAREKGAYISINHPHDFGCPSCFWQWGWDIDYDWVEVWNGVWGQYNQKTLDWWQEQLVSGNHLVAVGGSDTHGPHPYLKHGMPTTWVYSKSRSAQDILDAIHKGHVCLSYAPTGPFISLTCGDAKVGDQVVRQGTDLTLQLKIEHVYEGDIIKLISDQGVEDELRVLDDTAPFVHVWMVTNQCFFRVEVWRYFEETQKHMMAAMCNPIYFV